MTLIDLQRGAVDWPAELARILDDPRQPRLVFQPIVDLARGVAAGYETLARFDGTPYRSPDQWFAAAARLGYASQLEARVLERALDVLDQLPPGTFLTVNISPNLLGSDSVKDALAGRNLHRLVLELTEHVAFGDDDELAGQLRRVRRQGALIALDDAGSGYSGLQQLLSVRPDIVKLDRALVADADQDEAKLALAEMLGAFAGQLDAWLLAEGLETDGELEAMIRLGVPLGQGYLLGRPAADLDPLPPALAHRIRRLSQRSRAREDVGGLLEAGTTVTPDAIAAADRLPSGAVLLPGEAAVPLAVVRPDGCPDGLLLPMARQDDPPGAFLHVMDVTAALATTGVAELARRAVARPPSRRFDPVVCTDVEGRYVGIVRVERLITRLCDSS